jgi:hypothetical protein
MLQRLVGRYPLLRVEREESLDQILVMVMMSARARDVIVSET